MSWAEVIELKLGSFGIDMFEIGSFTKGDEPRVTGLARLPSELKTRAPLLLNGSMFWERILGCLGLGQEGLFFFFFFFPEEGLFMPSFFFSSLCNNHGVHRSTQLEDSAAITAPAYSGGTPGWVVTRNDAKISVSSPLRNVTLFPVPPLSLKMERWIDVIFKNHRDLLMSRTLNEPWASVYCKWTVKPSNNFWLMYAILPRYRVCIFHYLNSGEVDYILETLWNFTGS